MLAPAGEAPSVRVRTIEDRKLGSERTLSRPELGPVADAVADRPRIYADANVPAGIVSFEVTNDGPNDVHEFVVVRTDLAPSELPTDETGAVLAGQAPEQRTATASLTKVLTALVAIERGNLEN